MMTAQGRDLALFGCEAAGPRDFFERSLIADQFPDLYFEFPLMGAPCLDMIAAYEHVNPGARFAPGGGFGYQRVFDWISGQQGMTRSAIGLELDLSQGETEHAGIYFEPMGDTRLVPPFLAAVGHAGRAESCIQMMERLPRGWIANYVGLFPTRANAPIRLGGCLGLNASQRSSMNPAFFATCFDAVGFGAYDARMLEQCAELMGFARFTEYQFDLLPNGDLGHDFGLVLSFSGMGPQQTASCFSHGYGRALMETLESWGLADDRWKLIPGATMARRVAYEREDKGTGHLAVSLCPHYAKVKFVGGTARMSKFYLSASVVEMGR